MNRNFDAFELNHWYVYTGTENEYGWNIEMDFVLSHQPVKCTSSSSPKCAGFNGSESWHWYPNGFDNWIEIEATNKELKVNINDCYYDSVCNSIKTSKHDGLIVSKNHYKLTRPPFEEDEEVSDGKVKKEIPIKKIKLSPNDEDMIESVRPEELPCACYIWSEDCIEGKTLFDAAGQKVNNPMVNILMLHTNSNIGARCFAIPVKRVEYALKFVSNVKLSDLKPGTKVKIKEDAEWMDKDPWALRGKTFTVTEKDMNGWGDWNRGTIFSNRKDGISFEECSYRYPLHWIEKIVGNETLSVSISTTGGNWINIGNIKDVKIYKKKDSKYIKLNKKPIKKNREYKVHKQEYISLSKKR